MRQEDIDRFVPGGRLTSDYGPRSSGFHRGIDIGPPTPGQHGVEVFSGVKGRVTDTGGEWSLVEVDSGNGYFVRYLHLASINLNVGDDANPNTVVGEMGGSGPAGPDQYPIHLHLAVRDSDWGWIDPEGVPWEDLS